MTAHAVPARPPFHCREQAGWAVAQELGDLRGATRLIVLGLPRGGVVVAEAVADALGAPCDVIVARKLGVPGVEEVAFGAIAEGCHQIVDDPVRSYIGIPKALVQRVVERERRELERRVRAFRGDRQLPSLKGMIVVLVDDGMATGATMHAAVLAVRAHNPASITVAVPVASRAACESLAPVVTRVAALHVPEHFTTVSDSYEEFAQVSDDDVRRLLSLPAHASVAPVEAANRVSVEQAVAIPVDTIGATIAGDLELPDDDRTPHGLVIFAHGGGSSRHSYRNAFLAAWLQAIGWSTLRIDLLLPDEQGQDARDGSLRFDIALIARRLTAAVDWSVRERVPGHQNVILFGASTGAAAAVLTAVARPGMVRGVMSRGGRVDLAAAAFDQVDVPVLMVVGTRDPDTLRGTREALRVLRGDPTLRLVRGAGHTFEEPGALGAVGRHVEAWLRTRQPTPVRASWFDRFRDWLMRAPTASLT